MIKKFNKYKFNYKSEFRYKKNSFRIYNTDGKINKKIHNYRCGYKKKSFQKLKLL
jgi:hypothetical protein